MKIIKLSDSVKYFITVIVAVKIGSLFTDILKQTDINVWIARAIGCGSCVITGLLFIRLWLKDDKSK